uniref:Synaptic vesicle glycoprotein 2 n=1 Tax=Takifugu rubripes TaxID=31033 RepID=A0A674NEQ1_TAKRU
MPHHRVHVADAEVRAPLLTGNSADTDSDEGEIIFDRMAQNLKRNDSDDAGKRLSYEEAVEKAGFGLFHWILLAVCGWANASDAVEILCVSFLLPTARCDLHLSSSDMGLLTASIFLGMMVGGYVWGYLADRRGRRNILVVSLAINGVFGSLASLAPVFWLFLLLRFISGIGVGGSIPVVFSYFSEFMPRLRRGAMISALATFWMAGNILAAGLAWMVIPRTRLFFSLGPLDFQSWRMFVALCSIPSLTSAVIFIFMPESPRFLLEAAREKEAVRVFQAVFRINMWRKRKDLPVRTRQYQPLFICSEKKIEFIKVIVFNCFQGFSFAPKLQGKSSTRGESRLSWRSSLQHFKTRVVTHQANLYQTPEIQEHHPAHHLLLHLLWILWAVDVVPGAVQESRGGGLALRQCVHPSSY